jgi:TRAP-type C4-dicarboxylate transport system permease small subunit
MAAFGAGAVTVMVLAHALERRHRAFVALFAVGCALSSAYGFAIGSFPLGSVEALLRVFALQRFARSVRTYRGSV